MNQSHSTYVLYKKNCHFCSFPHHTVANILLCLEKSTVLAGCASSIDCVCVAFFVLGLCHVKLQQLRCLNYPFWIFSTVETTLWYLYYSTRTTERGKAWVQLETLKTRERERYFMPTRALFERREWMNQWWIESIENCAWREESCGFRRSISAKNGSKSVITAVHYSSGEENEWIENFACCVRRICTRDGNDTRKFLLCPCSWILSNVCDPEGSVASVNSFSYAFAILLESNYHLADLLVRFVMLCILHDTFKLLLF